MTPISLDYTTKAFHLTALSLALALSGCGGGDGNTVDVIQPVPDSGGNNGNGNGNGDGNGGTTTPEAEADFFIQTITADPGTIQLGKAPQQFTIVVKAVQKATGGAVANKDITVSVANSQASGVTIDGSSTQTTDSTGNATYTLTLNPNAVADRQKLLKDGVSITATAKAADGSLKSQLLVVGVSEAGDDGSAIKSDIEISSSLQSSTTSASAINPYGDEITVSVQAKTPKGAAAEGVDVNLGINNLKGVSILGGNTKKTNANGVATFNVKVADNLTAAERKALIQSGIAYNIKLTEADGKTVSEAGNWTVANPVSDYNLAVTGNSTPLSAYGATQTLKITASPKSAKVPTKIAGATAKVVLNGAPVGVSLKSNTVTLDDKGQATVNLVVAENLTEAQKNKLVTDGISYTVTLTEPSKATTVVTASSKVYIPQAAYKIIFDTSDKKQLSSSGGTAVITFRVSDKNGGPVEGQKVVASLPSAIKQSSLVALDSAAEQTTDNKGMVSYTVRIPTGLTEAQKAELEGIKSFALGVSIKETTGVVSSTTSQAISVSSEVGQSDIVLTTQTDVDSVNVLGDTFKVRVNAANKNGGAATGQQVKLLITGISGISIAGGNTKTTNDNGLAEFTVTLSNKLTAAQKEKLINEGINYLAILTAADGTQSKVSSNVPVAQPASGFNIQSITTSPINELGGKSTVIVQLVDSKNASKPVVSQAVSLALTNSAKLNGVTLEQGSATTDIEGKAIFTIDVPSTLTPAQRTALKAEGITFQASYEENGISYQSAIKRIAVASADIRLTVLNPETVVNGQPQYELSNTGDLATVKLQLLDNDANKPLNGKSVELVLDNAEFAKLITVNGQIGSARVTATTDANGVVSFDLNVPNNLTQQQRDTLNNRLLKATLTETVTGKKQTVGISIKTTVAEVALKATVLDVLNLNGGETQIQVVAQDSKGNVVAGQSVVLALPAAIAQQGIVIASNPKQTTNSSGIATFTVAAPNGLTSQQKAAIGGSFSVGIAATDSNGNTVSQTVAISTKQPAATQEKLTLGANKVVNTEGDTFKVFARITDVNGDGVANSAVKLAVAEPVKTGVSISSSNTVNTNGDGVAEFDLVLAPGANVDKVLLEKGIKLRATAVSTDGVSLAQDYIVNVDTTTIDSYVLMASADKSRLNTGGDQTSLTFRVLDNQGGVLAGVPVQLSIDDPKQSGAALTTTSVVTTDAQGSVTAGLVLGASSVNARLNHDIIVKAKIITPEYDQNGSPVLNTRAEEQVILQAIGTTLKIEASELNLRDDVMTTVTTTLVDAAGNAIENAAMQLVDRDGNPVAGSSSVQTNVDGIATFTLDESKLSFDVNGNLRIFAKASGEQGLVTQTSQSSVNLVKVSQAGISFADLEGIYNVNEPQELKVQIRLKNAQQLIGKQVEVQTTLGKFANGKVITTETITAGMIDGDSIIVPITLTSELAGTAVLNATVLGQTNSAGEPLTTTVDTRFRATTPAKMLLQAERSVIKPGGSTDIIAIVKDKNSVPVEGVTVVFSRDKDSSAGRLSAATAVTNERGEARVTYKANAMSPVKGVIINAVLLDDSANIGQLQTTITVSEEAVYTTLAFSDKVSSSADNIYYTRQGSISVMDGSGRAVANKQVSLKSYATRYAQGFVCRSERNVYFNGEKREDTVAGIYRSEWLNTEDPQFDYILDKNDDLDGNGKLEAINPVTILGGTLSEDDDYTFVTDAEGKVDFSIRYPKMYAGWTQVTFDSTTLVNGSENLQSFNFALPLLEADLVVTDNKEVITPYINNTSPFGQGNQLCINNLTIDVLGQKSTISGSILGITSNATANLLINGTDRVDIPAVALGNSNSSFTFTLAEALVKGTLVSVRINDMVNGVERTRARADSVIYTEAAE